MEIATINKDSLDTWGHVPAGCIGDQLGEEEKIRGRGEEDTSELGTGDSRLLHRRGTSGSMNCM